jgi:multiple sugar transport system ATP-binding protein
MAVVTLNNIVKSYDGEKVLRDLSFETEDGEFFVLLGPSGAGKTTTLKVIAGLEDIDSGEVLFDGRPMNAVPTNQRPVGMTFESYALYPHFTVFNNLANSLRAPGQKHTASEITRRVTTVAKMLKIDHLLDRRPGELSGGQKQRVSLGRTLVREPSIYLLDEPLTHVDAKIRFELRLQFHRMEELQKSTTIYVTHDYVEALSLGNRIAIIDNGKIVQVGTPRQIYDHPLNVFVAGLVGQPPINFFDAILKTNGQGSALMVPKGDFSIPISQKIYKALEQVQAPPELRVGIRPRDIILSQTTEQAMVQARCDVFEPFGSLGLLSVIVNDMYLELLVDPEMHFEPYTLQGLHLRDDRLLFFDPVTKMNLLASEA